MDLHKKLYKNHRLKESAKIFGFHKRDNMFLLTTTTDILDKE
jgi:hypothetical protein